jgi:hypothetical protein
MVSIRACVRHPYHLARQLTCGAVEVPADEVELVARSHGRHVVAHEGALRTATCVRRTGIRLGNIILSRSHRGEFGTGQGALSRSHEAVRQALGCAAKALIV